MFPISVIQFFLGVNLLKVLKRLNLLLLTWLEGNKNIFSRLQECTDFAWGIFRISGFPESNNFGNVKKSIFCKTWIAVVSIGTIWQSTFIFR